MFFSIWFWYHAFDTFHLNQIFCFYLYLNVKKVILLDMNNLYKLQTLIKATLPLIYWRVFLGDPHIYWHVSYEGYFCFKYITFSWEAVIMPICCWKCLCFGHFECLTYLCNILHSPNMHLSCQTSIYNVNLSTCLCFYVLSSPDMHLSWQYATNLPLISNVSIHLTCTQHVNNSLNMSLLTFYFHLTCT